ncbi:hypothetical protein [Actinocorallia libanotica]|uniref:JAB domain-containing protein n=1 Tax=Actinocorallia libanotica TaxID=46162 RepID=A0ABP4BWG9_9ACTN
MTASLRLHPAAVQELIEHVRQYGQQDVETGGLLITRPRDSEVVVLALAGEKGIRREEGLFVITMPALDELFSYAEGNDLQVRAMIHSHKRRAFMSVTDRTAGLNIRGFVSAIIPTYDHPPPDPNRWGWWRHEGDWHPTAPAVVDFSLPLPQIVVFDAGGVRDH